MQVEGIELSWTASDIEQILRSAYDYDEHGLAESDIDMADEIDIMVDTYDGEQPMAYATRTISGPVLSGDRLWPVLYSHFLDDVGEPNEYDANLCSYPKHFRADPDGTVRLTALNPAVTTRAGEQVAVLTQTILRTVRDLRWLVSVNNGWIATERLQTIIDDVNRSLAEVDGMVFDEAA